MLLCIIFHALYFHASIFDPTLCILFMHICTSKLLCQLFQFHKIQLIICIIVYAHLLISILALCLIDRYYSGHFIFHISTYISSTMHINIYTYIFSLYFIKLGIFTYASYHMHLIICIISYASYHMHHLI